MTLKGNLLKMSASVNEQNQVHYKLVLGSEEILLNELIGSKIQIKFDNIINCIACQKVTRKSYAQGFCFTCLQTVPQADDCVLRPVLCKAHLGIARNMDYANEHCLKPHFVYLANTGEIKVGVTRQSQIPTRWIDQGATYAVKVCMTPNRHMAGLVEMHLNKIFSDKTIWKKMVTNTINGSVNLLLERTKAIEALTPEMRNFICDDNMLYEFNYPVISYPSSPKSVSLDNEPVLSGILKGIKGQYLLFDNDRVINIRRHSGYLVEIYW